MENKEQLQLLINALLNKHRIETPFLLMDRTRMLASLNLFRKHLPKVKLFYALKANPAPEVVDFFVNEGLCFDVASQGEIDSLVSRGVTGDRILLSTPIKKIETIQTMFETQVSSFSVDTKAELDRIVSMRPMRTTAHVPQVFVRLRVDSHDVEIDLNTKFGCSRAEALDIIGHARKLDFQIAGICFHVGTQSLDPENYRRAIRIAMTIGDEAQQRFNVRFPIINIGGGFCSPEAASRRNINLIEYYQTIRSACDEAVSAGYRLYAEPGRALVASSGFAVTSVMGTNIRSGRHWAYLDDGIYGCFSVKLYETSPFEFLRINRGIENAIGMSSWTLGGPTADSLDVIGENIQLPSDLAAGDILVVPNIGAYSLSTACNFNGFNVPKCYLTSLEELTDNRPARSHDNTYYRDPRILTN
jgi:ornithine decarboxylase